MKRFKVRPGIRCAWLALLGAAWIAAGGGWAIAAAMLAAGLAGRGMR